MSKTFGETANDAAKAAGKAVGNAAAKVTGKAVGNAAEATDDYLTQKKDEAVKTAQEKIATLDKKWQELQAKTLAEAKTKLAEAKNAGADAWQKNVKPALDAALDKAQKLYDDTAARFGSK